MKHNRENPVPKIYDERLGQADKDRIAEAHGVDVEGKVHALSYSKLSSYRRCGEQYRLRYLDKVPEVQLGAGLAGQAVHTVIEEMVMDGWWRRSDVVMEQGAERFLAVFRGLVEEHGGPDQIRWTGRKTFIRNEDGSYWKDPATGERLKANENLPWWEKMGPTHVKRAGAILRNDAREGTRVVEASVERRVSAWLDGPGSTLITGIVDVMLLAEKDDAPKIRDWKTGTFIDYLQLANYAWLLSHIEEEDQRIYPQVGEMAYLRGNSSDSWIKRYDLKATLEAGVIERMFHDAELGLGREVYQLNPSSFCKSCSVRPFCVHGKTIEED